MKKANNDIQKMFSKVRLLILDVDGTLTKGEIIYDDKGRELKIFNVKDGLGVFLLHIAGIKTVIFSAKDSDVLRKRGKDMCVAEVIGGVLPKEKMLPALTKKYKVSSEEICFVADDVIDIGLMEKVGLGVAVADAHTSVRKCADFVTKNKGGEGAVREVADLIIYSQQLGDKVERFLRNPNFTKRR